MNFTGLLGNFLDIYMVRGQIFRIFTGYFLDSRKKFSGNLQYLYVQDHGNVQKSCKFEFSEYLRDIYRIISVKPYY